MNDEAHGDQPEGVGAQSVLRPFEPPEQPPLPPIEPSKVVPEPPVVAEEVVEEPPVPPPPPVDALEDDPWSPEGEFSESDVETESVDADEVADSHEVADDADADSDDGDDDAGEDEPVPDDGSETAGALPDAAPVDQTITLPRKPFLVGLGVLLGAIALLAVLWQTGGDDDAPDTTVAQDPTLVDDPVDSPPPTQGDDAAVDVSAEQLAEAQAEIASLEFEVDSLQERPPPALDGSMLRRIVVGADAKFVSALPESVAVVGAFGGLSLIDPETNRVVANGNIADAATRVMRTSSSVWLTNYSDNQLLRVDPATNTVAATFAFPGPDGIEKDGDTIVVASFDGEFVARVDPGSGEILQQVDVGGTPTEVISHPEHGLWAAVFDTGEIVEIDRDSFEILRRVTVGRGPVGIYAAATTLWVANHDEGTIVRVNPETGVVAFTVEVGAGPTELVVKSGSAWVTVTDDGSLVQVDARNGELISRTPLGGASAGGGPTGISFADNTLWIAMQGEQSVVRVDLD